MKLYNLSFNLSSIVQCNYCLFHEFKHWPYNTHIKVVENVNTLLIYYYLICKRELQMRDVDLSTKLCVYITECDL